MGIKTRGNQYKLRIELPANRVDDCMKQLLVFFVTPARGDRQVDGIAFTLSLPNFLGSPGSRVVGILMGGDVQYSRGIVKAVLRPVAMVHIPIHEQNPPQAKLFTQILGTDRRAVEQAKAHRPSALGVMSWRPYESKAVVHLTRHDGFEYRQ